MESVYLHLDTQEHHAQTRTFYASFDGGITSIWLSLAYVRRNGSKIFQVYTCTIYQQSPWPKQMQLSATNVPKMHLLSIESVRFCMVFLYGCNCLEANKRTAYPKNVGVCRYHSGHCFLIHQTHARNWWSVGANKGVLDVANVLKLRWNALVFGNVVEIVLEYCGV